MRQLSNSVASKFSFLRPLDIGLKKFQPFVDTIKSLNRRFSGWYTYLLAGAMWPIEQAINILLYPFRSQINRMIAQLNPFGRIDALMIPLVAPLRDIIDEALLNAQLEFLKDIQNMSDSKDFKEKFKEMANYLCLAVAITQRGFFGLLEGLLIQGSNNVGFFQELMGEEFNTIEDLMDEMRFESPVVTIGDTILNMKKSIDGPLEKCDSYLLMNSKDCHTFEDGFTDDKLASYFKSSDYDLAHCAINPSSDKSSALFEYGKADDGSPKNSWMLASIAAILHHGKVTEQAVHIGALTSDSTILASFIPEDKGSGKYTVSLKPKMAGSMKVFNVDSRLPIQKIPFPPLKSFEDFPTDIFDYANKRILAQVYPIFSERYSLALVEKVIACELNMAETESIGTAIHLLSGNCSGYCYKRSSNSNEWRTYIGNGPGRKTEKYDTLALESTADENKSD
jgi:hypothetical protein